MTEARPALHNIEAEQAVLGALLYDNGAFEYIDARLRGAHFGEPFHGDIFELAASMHAAGHLVDPTLLDTKLQSARSAAAYADMGGIRYLADLVDKAPPSTHARDYARDVLDLALRRDATNIALQGVDALDKDRETPARDHLDAIEQGLFALAETSTTGGFRAFSDVLTGAIDMAAEAYQRDGGLAGISTGLIDLDAKTGGLHPSDLVIIAARPSMGKTALGLNIAFDVAKRFRYTILPDGSRKTEAGGVVAFFSLEMSGEQLAMRVLADVSGVSSDKIRKGQITAAEFGKVRDASLLIAQSPLHIDATGGLSVGKLAARARRLKRTAGLDLIVVDYIQLITVDGRQRPENRVLEVTAITQALKALAKELGIPIIALAQLSRQVEQREDKRPQLSDLRESGSIEQDADVVMFIYREEYYLSRTEPREGTPEHLAWLDKTNAVQGLAELIIGKQRHGPIGVVRAHYDAATTKFSNLAKGQDQATGRLPYGVD